MSKDKKDKKKKKKKDKKRERSRSRSRSPKDRESSSKRRTSVESSSKKSRDSEKKEEKVEAVQVKEPVKVVEEEKKDFSKMSAEEKRKLLSAGKGSRKAAYSGAEFSNPLQALKFKKFMKMGVTKEEEEEALKAKTTKNNEYKPEQGTVGDDKLEHSLAQQFDTGRKYQFSGYGQKKGLGSL